MKIDRLIGILSVLLQQDKVTAPSLAERFEVSRRTINRDIEDLCRAGIPIATTQGAGGGISIMEGYKLDRTLLTSSDMQAIVAGLRSLDSVSGGNRYARLMEKLSLEASGLITGDQHILIDLSSWHKESLSPKIDIIHGAIAYRRLLSFTYSNQSGESVREIEPYHLVFRWTDWYVWGWCREKEDYRLFKLKRMKELHCDGREYEKRAVPPPDLSDQRVFPPRVQLRAVFEPDCRWRLEEEYGEDCFVEREDGKLLCTVSFTQQEYLLRWILSFGDKAELLEPQYLREELLKIGKALGKMYGAG